jgi:hypothetical protein
LWRLSTNQVSSIKRHASTTALEYLLLPPRPQGQAVVPFLGLSSGSVPDQQVVLARKPLQEFVLFHGQPAPVPLAAVAQTLFPYNHVPLLLTAPAQKQQLNFA